MNQIKSPLTLVSGTHDGTHGIGCVMNVVSWVNGDYQITDRPNNIATPLVNLFQMANDTIAWASPGGGSLRGRRTVPKKYGRRILQLAMDAIGTDGTEHDVDLGQWALRTNLRTLPLGVLTLFSRSHQDAFFFPLPGLFFKARMAAALEAAVSTWLELAGPLDNWTSRLTLEETERAIKAMAHVQPSN